MKIKFEHMNNLFFLNKLPIFLYKEYGKLTIIQFCDLVNIVIPRFCYHIKLSVAGNCRMCLVELVGSPKPVIACATTIMNKLDILTDSLFVRKLREDVLELLLINHPLDCPICDQGGECDLQEQVYSFGSDHGRFKEMKRSVADKRLGPIVKTIMTRCIHCTRCIRFTEEYLGISNLGIFGRGSGSEVKVNKAALLNSELSGNLVDICPVGALTSKPFAFTCRPWELKSIESIDCFDSLNSNIRVDVKGNRIFRILPKRNELLNEEWISDFTRFSYEGLQSFRSCFPILSLDAHRVKSFFKRIKRSIWHLFGPESFYEDFLIRERGYYCCIRVDWSHCIEFLKILTVRFKFNTVNFFVGSGVGLLNISFFYYLSKFIKNSSFNIEGLPSMDIDSRSSFYVDSFNLFKKANFFLFYNLNLKENFSVFNSRLYNHLYKLQQKKIIYYIGRNIKQSYSVFHIGHSLMNFVAFLRGKHLTLSHFNSTGIRDLNVSLFSSSINFNSYLEELKYFNSISVNNFNFFSNVMGYSELGVNSELVNRCSKSSLRYFLKTSKIILNKKDDFFIYQGLVLPNVDKSTNYLFLPTLNSFEQPDSYVNIFGSLQDSAQVLNVSDGYQPQPDFYVLKDTLFSLFFYSIEKKNSFLSLDLLFNELVCYYLDYFVLMLDFYPYKKQLNFKSMILKKNNSYFFSHSFSNLNIKNTFMVKYSDTLRAFYKQQNNICKSSFF